MNISAQNTVDVAPSFFDHSGHYGDFRAAWKKSCRENKRLRAEHFALYAMLRGRDLNDLFTPITNSVKLQNGMDPRGALKRTTDILKWCSSDRATAVHVREDLLSTFDGTVTHDMLKAASSRYLCFNE